jgi:hypothetical protein
LLVGHVVWEGRPAQPHTLQQLPITLTIKSGTTEINYPTQNTDASGFFTVSLGTLSDGLYDYRVKGPKFLANSGSFAKSGPSQLNVEMGLMLAGDCNNSNVITIQDLGIIRNSLGRGFGDPGYDDRGDLDGNLVVNVLDFNLLKRNFGLDGAPPLSPQKESSLFRLRASSRLYSVRL